MPPAGDAITAICALRDRQASRSRSAIDIEALLDVEPAHLLTCGPGLLVMSCADLGASALASFATFGDLHAAVCRTRVDLRFHDHHGVPGAVDQALGDGGHLVDVDRRLTLRDSDPVATKQLLGLVLVDLHSGRRT
jgi:hypothetical protein